MRLATKSAIFIALIAALLSFIKFDHCRNHGWGGSDVYIHACYSDLPALLVDRNLNTHTWPYKSATNAVEYPPLTAMVMWSTSYLVKHDYNQYRTYFDINALLIILLFIFVVILLKKMSPKYWYLAPLAPAVIASLFINWDIWAVLPALLAIYWFDQKLYRRSSLALGISIATKFFPIVLLLPISLILLKNRKELIKYNAIALGSWISINLPFALTTPKGWFRFFKLNSERGVDWGSIWHALNIYGIKIPSLNYFSLALFVIGAMAFTIYFFKLKEFPNLAMVSIFIVAIFVTASKVYSPQYILWLTPIAVLAITSSKEVKAFWIWQGAELIYHLAIWQELASTAGAHFAIPERLYAFAILLRVCALAYFLSTLARGKLEKSPLLLPPQAHEFPL